MIYNFSGAAYRAALDDWKTGRYGEDDFTDTLECCNCGFVIREGCEYYDVNGDIYCMECESVADEAILGLVREEYRYIL